MRTRKLNLAIAFALLLVAGVAGIVYFGSFDQSRSSGVSEDPIRRTRILSWYDNSVGIAEQIYDGQWNHFDVEAGDGTYIYIEIGAFDTRTFDAAGRFVLGIQLPSGIWPDEEFELRSTSKKRKTTKIDSETTVTKLRPGEFTAFQYGNPFMGWMAPDSLSAGTISISEINAEFVSIHLVVDADLGDFGRLKLDDSYELSRIVAR